MRYTDEDDSLLGFGAGPAGETGLDGPPAPAVGGLCYFFDCCGGGRKKLPMICLRVSVDT